MFHVHGYLDNKLVVNCHRENIPRTGDTVRIASDKYAEVTEVIWCFDEPANKGERVNIRMETIGETDGPLD